MIITQLTLDELRMITWDYSSEDAKGFYHGKLIFSYLWEAVECGEVNPMLVSKCNVAEGWLEYLDAEVHKNDSGISVFTNMNMDEHGDVIRKEILCKVVVNLLDRKGNVIVTLR